MQLGESKLLVQLSCQTSGQRTTGPINTQMQLAGIDLSKGAGPPTEVLCLMNIVNENDLRDDEEYEGKFLILIFFKLYFCRYF